MPHHMDVHVEVTVSAERVSLVAVGLCHEARYALFIDDKETGLIVHGEQMQFNSRYGPAEASSLTLTIETGDLLVKGHQSGVRSY